MGTTHTIEAKIVNDALVATPGVGVGGFIPFLILDTSRDQEVAELIRIHSHFTSGDVVCRWGWSKDFGIVALELEFVRPAQLRLALRFDVASQGCLVDKIIASGAVCIQGGKHGDRLMNTWDSARILIDVPDTGFKAQWDRILPKGIVRKLKQTGVKSRLAKTLAPEIIQEWRKLDGFRTRE